MSRLYLFVTARTGQQELEEAFGIEREIWTPPLRATHNDCRAAPRCDQKQAYLQHLSGFWEVESSLVSYHQIITFHWKAQNEAPKSCPVLCDGKWGEQDRKKKVLSLSY